MSEHPPGNDHVKRIVRRYFNTADGALLIGGISVSQLAKRFGTPLFVYDQSVIQDKIQQIRSLLPASFALFYSIKANPNAAILQEFIASGCGLEVASGGELFQALDARCPADQIIFAGPGKTREELAAAVEAGIREIHVESLEEARWLHEEAISRDRIATIALRINPMESAGGAMRMGGCASPFGIDEENLDQTLHEILRLQRLSVTGVHIFMGTQILDAKLLIEQYQRALAIARYVAERLDHPLSTIDFGGGLGTPYFARESDLDLTAWGEGLATIASQMRSDPLLAKAEGIFEPGRFLVSESGVYLCKVSRVKNSRGKVFAVLDGGMHHHLAASGNLGQTIKRNFPVAIVNKMDQPAAQKVEVVGPLCTPLDTLGRGVELAVVEPNDLFGVFQSGAYARTSSPHGFLSHQAPPEVLVTEGVARLIRRRGQQEDLLRDQHPQWLTKTAPW